MNPRTYWADYINDLGGPTPAAERLGIAYSTIAGVCNGSRGIGRRLAKRLKQVDPSLNEGWLVLVEPSPPPTSREVGHEA